MSAETPEFVRTFTRADKISCSVVKVNGVERIFREVGGKYDRLFSSDWDGLYEPGGYLAKEDLPQESSPVQKQGQRKTSHNGQKI